MGDRPESSAPEGHLGCLGLQDTDNIAPSIAGVAADSAGLWIKINDFLTDSHKVYGNFIVSVLANMFWTILLAIIPWILRIFLKDKEKERQDSFGRSLELRLARLEAITVSDGSTPPSDADVSQSNAGNPSNDTANGALQSDASKPAVPDTSNVPSSSNVSKFPLQGGHRNGYIEVGSRGFGPVEPSHRDTASGSGALNTNLRVRSFQLKRSWLFPSIPSLGRLNVSKHLAQMYENFSNWTRSSPPHGSRSAADHDDATIQAVFPNSARTEVPDQFEDDIEKGMGGREIQRVSSSWIVQAKAKLTAENFRTLRDVVVKNMKRDRDSTYQIGMHYLYYCNGNPEEPVLVNLKENKVKVPTVLQADYSAGILTIRGAYLEGAEFRATTPVGYMILKPTMLDKPSNKIIEEWQCTDQLPPCNLETIRVFASKRVTIEGQTVTVRSEITPIENIFWRTVFRKWMPNAFLIVYLMSNVWRSVTSLFNLVEDPHHRFCIIQLLPAIAIFVCQLLPIWVEDSVKSFIRRLKLAYSSFHVSPNLISSPAFFLHNGLCYQRGAEHLVDRKFAIGGPGTQANPSPREQAGSGEQAGCSGEHAGFGEHVGSCEQVDPSLEEEKPIEDVPYSKFADVTSDSWQWSCFEEKKGVLQKLDPKSSADDQSKSSNLVGPSEPFHVTYVRFHRTYDSTYDILQDFGLRQTAFVTLHSKYLLRVINGATSSGEISGIKLLEQLMFQSDLCVQGPVDSNETTDIERLHMRHLFRFLETEYNDILTQRSRVKEAGVISFKMLWTVIVPGVDVVYHCDLTQEELCGKVISANYSNSKSDHLEKDNAVKFMIVLEVYDFDCVDFGPTTIDRKITEFSDEVKITSLITYPICIKDNSEEAVACFLKRGQRFCDLVLRHEHRFMHYQGLLYVPLSKHSDAGISMWGFRSKESIDGRVMVDQGGFAKMKPNRAMGTARRRSKGERSQLEEEKIKTIQPLLKYAPAIVFGCSLSSRRWGCFLVEGFRDIHFEKTAFEKSLIMNEELKKTLLALSKHHINLDMEDQEVKNPDPLPNKGEGCIILLYGPPGTGKTLTVETIAEKLECPLWQLSISKLSSSTKKLETKLLRKFEIAVSWRAILLLDEADVYLAQRKYNFPGSEITRNNAMAGVFLRVLEYYKGILFLTTNMVDCCEEAIFSRMSLMVEYKEFGEEERKILWQRCLGRIGFNAEILSLEFWKKVLPLNFNGRVIRNVIHNAQIFARSEGRAMSQDDLLSAFRLVANPSARKYLIQHDENYQVEALHSDLTTQTDRLSGPPPSVSTDNH